MRYALALLILLGVTGMAEASYVQKIREKWHPGLPNPSRYLGTPIIQGYIVWIPVCAASATIIATITLQRELEPAEAYTIIGSCVVPVLGGMVMKRLFESHPEWNAMFKQYERYTYEYQLGLH